MGRLTLGTPGQKILHDQKSQTHKKTGSGITITHIEKKYSENATIHARRRTDMVQKSRHSLGLKKIPHGSF